MLGPAEGPKTYTRTAAATRRGSDVRTAEKRPRSAKKHLTLFFVSPFFPECSAISYQQLQIVSLLHTFIASFAPLGSKQTPSDE